jgi:hypothetical protein
MFASGHKTILIHQVTAPNCEQIRSMRGGDDEDDDVWMGGRNDGVQDASRRMPGPQVPSTAIRQQEFSSWEKCTTKAPPAVVQESKQEHPRAGTGQSVNLEVR